MGRIAWISLGLLVVAGAMRAQPEPDFIAPVMEHPGIYMCVHSPFHQGIHRLWGTNFLIPEGSPGHRVNQTVRGDVILFMQAENEEQLAAMQAGMTANRIEYESVSGVIEVRTPPLDLSQWLAPEMASGPLSRVWDLRGAEHDIQVMIRTHGARWTHVAKAVTIESGNAAAGQRQAAVAATQVTSMTESAGHDGATSQSGPIPETFGIHIYDVGAGTLERIMPWPVERADEGWPRRSRAVEVPPGTLLVVRTSADPLALSDLLEHVTAWSEEPMPDPGGTPGILRRRVPPHTLPRRDVLLTSDACVTVFDLRSPPRDLVLSLEWGEDGMRMIRTYTFPATLEP